MKDFFKSKIVTAVVVIATVILAGVAVFTALRLYQLRRQAVAPTAPESKPEASQPQTIACELLTFTLTQESPTLTPTGVAATPTATLTPSSTLTPTQPPIGGPSEIPTPTQAPTATNTPTLTPTPTQGLISAASPTPGGEQLPAAGITTPTIIALFGGLLILIFSLILAI